MPSKHIVFDVVGTCVTFTTFFTTIDTQLGARLRSQNISPHAFGYAWMEAAEREYANFSMSNRYTPFLSIFDAIFYRTLHFCGIADPRTFATDEDKAILIKSYHRLEPREGLATTMQMLRDAGFTVWCLTTGDVGRVRGYFVDNGVEMPAENFVSCDAGRVAKPALEAYRGVLRGFEDGDEVWFAAAHMWDVSAARAAGFKGAYCTAWEKEPCLEIFGEMDVMADTLVEMAAKVIEGV